MFESKTHFEQVPLKIVRKIVEEQIEGATTKPSRGIEKRILDENLQGGPRMIGDEVDIRSHGPE
jgi:hypothetical protein